jgi:SH3-like domain-containing protein
MPVLVFSEYGQWRQVKLCDGTAGWLHKSVLSGKKTAMLRCEAILWNEPSESSRRVAQLGQHVVVSVIKKKKKWTKVVVTAADGDKFTGWLQTKDLWGWGQSG